MAHLLATNRSYPQQAAAKCSNLRAFNARMAEGMPTYQFGQIVPEKLLKGTGKRLPVDVWVEAQTIKNQYRQFP